MGYEQEVLWMVLSWAEHRLAARNLRDGGKEARGCAH